MLIEGDASALEVVGAAYLSQDKVLCQEIRDGVDIHGRNQEALKLPSRLIAKIFVFRLIYGGSAFSYANDPEFNWISRSHVYWQEVIDSFYNKYTGLAKWHTSLVYGVQRTGRWTSPTGRTYEYTPVLRRGEYVWPRTTILNYPVQGLGADLMSIARVSAKRRLQNKVLFVNTVHDSIVVDSPPEIVYDVCTVMEDVFVDVPKNFERVFGKEFNLPMKGEVKFGMNWKDMEKFKRKNEYHS